jgi:hypothetical protein
LLFTAQRPSRAHQNKCPLPCFLPFAFCDLPFALLFSASLPAPKIRKSLIAKKNLGFVPAKNH